MPGQAPPPTGRGDNVAGTFDVVDNDADAVAGTLYRVVVTDPIGRASQPSTPVAGAMSALVPGPEHASASSPRRCGPWFSTDVNLPVPGDDLVASRWRSRPAPTGCRRRPGCCRSRWRPRRRRRSWRACAARPGTPPFTTGRLVAVFRLLPEVEQRLATLLADVPPADGTATTPGLVTRAAVRTFALELPETPPTLALLKDRIDPQIPTLTSPGEEAAHVGLTQSGGNLDNGAGADDRPQAARPVPRARDEKLLKFPTAATVKLFAFDERGRPIDPGAVAAWWTRLTTTFTNLFAAGVTQRTATVANQLTVQLVGPDDAPASRRRADAAERDQRHRHRPGARARHDERRRRASRSPAAPRTTRRCRWRPPCRAAPTARR